MPKASGAYMRYFVNLLMRYELRRKPRKDKVN